MEAHRVGRGWFVGLHQPFDGALLLSGRAIPPPNPQPTASGLLATWPVVASKACIESRRVGFYLVTAIDRFGGR